MVLRKRKGGHIGMTAIVPAKGPALPVLWTLAGQRFTKHRIASTKTPTFNLTHDGWADDTAFLLALEEVQAYKVRMGLEKGVLIVDNAKIHSRFTAIEYAVKKNIYIWGLIPQSTGYTQPLDVGFFGPLTRKVEMLGGDSINEHKLPKWVEKAM